MHIKGGVIFTVIWEKPFVSQSIAYESITTPRFIKEICSVIFDDVGHQRLANMIESKMINIRGEVMQPLDKEIQMKLTQFDAGLALDTSQKIFIEIIEGLFNLFLVMEQKYASENYKIFYDNTNFKTCLNSLQIKIQGLLCKENFLCHKNHSFVQAAKLFNKIHSVLRYTGAQNSAPVLPLRSIKITHQMQFDPTSNISDTSHSTEEIAQEAETAVKSPPACYAKCILNAYLALDAICNKVGNFKDFNAFADNMKLDPEWRKHFKINYDMTKSQRLIDLPPYELRGYDRETLHFLFSLAAEDKRFDAKQRIKFEDYVKIFKTKIIDVPDSNIEILKMCHISGTKLCGWQLLSKLFFDLNSAF